MRRHGTEKVTRIRALARPLVPVRGRIERVPAAGLFVLIRGEPRARWLPRAIQPDRPARRSNGPARSAPRTSASPLDPPGIFNPGKG